MEREKHYRHELKYVIPYADYLGMRERLQKVMSVDPHVSKDGLYQIRSIYFDNIDDKALREKIDGIGRREKFRIRYYNDDLSFITLEKKIKDNDLCLKYDAVISEEECRKILGRDLEFMKDHPEELVRELYAKMRYQGLKPRVLVSYVYDMYRYIGVDASLYNYAKISVNGEYWDIYLALEAVEESFMLRNYGTQDGELYKPDSMERGGSDSSSTSTQDSGGITPPSGQGGSPGGSSGFDPGNMPEGNGFDPGSMPEGGPDFGGGNMPDMSGFSQGTMAGSSKLMTLAAYGLCLLFMLVLLIGMHFIRRRR